MRNKVEKLACLDSRCLFHINETDCIIPSDKRFCHCLKGVIESSDKIRFLGVVDSCANRIYDEKDLSQEGKENLKKYKKDRGLI